MNKSMYQIDNSGYRQRLIEQVESIHEKYGVGVQVYCQHTNTLKTTTCTVSVYHLIV